MDKQLKEAQEKTIAALVKQSKRKSGVPIRNDFTQYSKENSPVPGRLGDMVKSGNGRSLDLYLLHRLIASAAPWDTSRPATVWARALGLGGEKYGKDAVSKCWTKLEGYGLIKRERVSRQAKITTLHENGQGDPYTSPEGKYFKLPLEYWTSGWSSSLSVAGKAALLIASSLRPGFYLPESQANRWYGISADSLGDGLRELQGHGLLSFETETVEDWGTSDVVFQRRHYTLHAPFGKGSKDPISLFLAS
ncbi:hypothetical protein [Arthrobacter sp. zg-Y895]|uniref:hypothetical protein n=1 Tax=Arthrobacter sp. zg-Y895 TaxID=2886933 RepID=UPI001D15591B|nr:hypothetical protein [Arthrobacter sp. zg-Y895]MCC3302776.1 hypothetical protein [Arthrobacter sp. zg-Y895]